MTLIRIVNKEVANLPYLIELVLTFIYEPELMPTDKRHLMEDSLINWANKLTLDKDMGRIDEGEEYEIQKLGRMLKLNEEGRYEARKKLYKINGVDWRKVHNIPHARTEADRIKGQIILNDWNKKNPEVAG